MVSAADAVRFPGKFLGFFPCSPLRNTILKNGNPVCSTSKLIGIVRQDKGFCVLSASGERKILAQVILLVSRLDSVNIIPFFT